MELQPISVHFQKCCRHSHRDPLVAVYEWMILGKALPKCSRFLNEVALVTAPRSCQSGFEGGAIPDAK